ncbi:unnamed protein product (mitochondrion) [Plasmodiophora brassicae]|uniref:ubiquitinyl hydrolase 1 n=1 Tax=Plasmodiophora brassicae TaxID=37360 RepID=A0A3P3Y0B6_PLABS|nr:unnamed protein product [Plasmodiophora brassicae]
MDVDVYFEQQDGSQLCAVHCVNNLLQGAVFTELDFAAIALDINRQESELMGNSVQPDIDELPNVSMSGEFSIQVISNAMRIMNVVLERCRDFSAAAQEDAFIINREDHWDRPVRCSEVYLEALLHQMHNEGASIFAVRGLTYQQPVAEGRGILIPVSAITGPSREGTPLSRPQSPGADNDLELAIALSLQQ